MTRLTPTNGDAPPALAFEGVDKRYPVGDGEVVALAGLSFVLRRGEAVALLGPSGSGKSTLLLIAGLLEPPTAGRVLIDGAPVAGPGIQAVDSREFRRRHLGFVFQKPNLIPFLTALENVQLALEIDDVPPRDARRAALALLETFDVAHRAGNLPKRLSRGEQQRVAIARAIANAPALLLADEPTAALDGVRGRQVMEIFAALAHGRGRAHDAAVLVVTHDHRALDAFDRVLEMEDGRLRQHLPAALSGARAANGAALAGRHT